MSFILSKEKVSQTIHEKQDIKRCYKCQSVYITDLACDECGIQFSKEPRGSFGDSGSFYGLKEEFCDGLSYFEKAFPWLENTQSAHAKRYASRLQHRFHILCLFLVTEHSETPLFKIEFQDLVRESMIYVKNTPLGLIQNLEPEIIQNQIFQLLWQEQAPLILTRETRPLRDLLSETNFSIVKVSLFSLSLYLLSSFLMAISG